MLSLKNMFCFEPYPVTNKYQQINKSNIHFMSLFYMFCFDGCSYVYKLKKKIVKILKYSGNM